MPLTEKGNEIRANMEKEYGPKKGEEVFYASKNKGTISSVDSMLGGGCDAVPIAKCYDQGSAVPGLAEHLKQMLATAHKEGHSSESVQAAARALQEHHNRGRDQSYPPMDPTSIGAMPTMERGEDGTNSPHDPRTGQFGRGGTTGGGHGPSTRELVEAANRNSPENKKKAAELAEFEKQNAGNTPAPRKTEAGATTRANQTHGPHQPGRGFHDDEPSQPSGMQEPTDAEQTPAERERLRGELRYGKARHEGKITGQEHKGFIEATQKNAAEKDADPDRLQFKSHEARNPVEERRAERERLRGEEAARRAGPTGPEPPKDAFEPTTAGCDPAMSFDEAVFSPAAHDYGADRYSSMGGLPETVTHRQMQNFGASFNFGEGVTK